MPDRVLQSPRGLDVGLEVLTSQGGLLTYPRNEIAPTAETVSAVTFYAPGLGLPVAEKRYLLAHTLPNGTDRYLGLFTGLPTPAGVGGVECADTSYSRIAISGWTNAAAGHVVSRTNMDAIEFAAFAGDVRLYGWGIWDASAGGTLRAFGRIRSASGAILAVDFAAGDTARFPAGAVGVGIQ